MGVSGSPPIFATILEKIDRAAIYVPDFTFVGKNLGGEPIPNPNVLIEYGWALKSLGYKRIVAVMNQAYGAPTREGDDAAELLRPFFERVFDQCGVQRRPLPR